MKCPIDGTALVITDRSGVEIDYCPQCRGVWLERRELDKLIDRSMGLASVQAPERAKSQQHSGYKKKKRGGFLEDLFDFQIVLPPQFKRWVIHRRL